MERRERRKTRGNEPARSTHDFSLVSLARSLARLPRTSLKRLFERVRIVDPESRVCAAREAAAVLIETDEQQLVRLTL